MANHAAAFRELKPSRVRRAFGMMNALYDITQSIRHGEFIALLAPSGCGKSTTLKVPCWPPP